MEDPLGWYTMEYVQESPSIRDLEDEITSNSNTMNCTNEDLSNTTSPKTSYEATDYRSMPMYPLGGQSLARSPSTRPPAAMLKHVHTVGRLSSNMRKRQKGYDLTDQRTWVREIPLSINTASKHRNAKPKIAIKYSKFAS